LPVHTGCQHCYAQTYFRRFGIGPDERRRTADWKKPLRWDKQAGEARPRVLCSLCDPFEEFKGRVTGKSGKGGTLDDLRADFFDLTDRTPRLTWILATKRPENVRRMWPLRSDGTDSGESDEIYLPNVWLLYSASDQETLDAGLPYLLACRDLVPVLGLSLEPLVAPVDLGVAHIKACPHGNAGKHVCDNVDWVVIGGESGPNARPCRVEWIRDIVAQCEAAGLPCYVKQDSAYRSGQQGSIPDELFVREFPQ
jgi:protein gp37